MKRHARVLGAAGVLVGSVFLLGLDCGGARDCTYDGKTWQDGASFPSPDGCNTCSCRDGAVACTERACAGQWFHTCGDPVCGPDGHRVDPNIPACTTEQLGATCSQLDALCDPGDPCNVHLVCATSDPTQGTGGCPISRARYKRDIRYLDAHELGQVRQALLDVRLATYHYQGEPADAPRQLGFIIDDLGPSPAVNANGETVNVYGYASMAVAALQAQAQEIAQLRADVAALKKRLDAK